MPQPQQVILRDGTWGVYQALMADRAKRGHPSVGQEDGFQHLSVGDVFEFLGTNATFCHREACVDAAGLSGATAPFTYADLYTRAQKLATYLTSSLKPSVEDSRKNVPTVATLMRRSSDWLTVYAACSLAGLPVVCLAGDMPVSSQEESRRRNQEIIDLLQPKLLILESSIDPRNAFTSAVERLVLKYTETIEFSELMRKESSAQEAHRVCVGGQSLLTWNFTSGTSSGVSKCVKVTHQMALHEICCYPRVFADLCKRSREAGVASAAAVGRQVYQPPERVLQQHSAFWGAALFGQVDMALAFGACLVFADSANGGSADLSRCIDQYQLDEWSGGWVGARTYDASCAEFFPSTHRTTGVHTLGKVLDPYPQVDCVGVVPSVLLTLDPDRLLSIRYLITWAEDLPTLATFYPWLHRGVICADLLIATEYWLSMYAPLATHMTSPRDVLYTLCEGLEVELLAADETSSDLGNVDSEQKTRRDTLEQRDPSTPGWCCRCTFGEMCMRGPAVSPGYVSSIQTAERFRGKWYLTRDLMEVAGRHLPTGCLCGRQYMYRGRTDDLTKIAGKFVSLRSVTEQLKTELGRECEVLGSGGCQAASGGRSVWIQMKQVTHLTATRSCGALPASGGYMSLSKLQKAVRRVLPGHPMADVHLLRKLPRKADSKKVDRQLLLTRLTRSPYADIFLTPDGQKAYPFARKLSLRWKDYWLVGLYVLPVVVKSYVAAHVQQQLVFPAAVALILLLQLLPLSYFIWAYTQVIATHREDAVLHGWVEQFVPLRRWGLCLAGVMCLDCSFLSLLRWLLFSATFFVAVPGLLFGLDSDTVIRRLWSIPLLVFGGSLRSVPWEVVSWARYLTSPRRLAAWYAHHCTDMARQMLKISALCLHFLVSYLRSKVGGIAYLTKGDEVRGYEGSSRAQPQGAVVASTAVVEAPEVLPLQPEAPDAPAMKPVPWAEGIEVCTCETCGWQGDVSQGCYEPRGYIDALLSDAELSSEEDSSAADDDSQKQENSSGIRGVCTGVRRWHCEWCWWDKIQILHVSRDDCGRNSRLSSYWQSRSSSVAVAQVGHPPDESPPQGAPALPPPASSVLPTGPGKGQDSGRGLQTTSSDGTALPSFIATMDNTVAQVLEAIVQVTGVHLDYTAQRGIPHTEENMRGSIGVAMGAPSHGDANTRHSNDLSLPRAASAAISEEADGALTGLDSLGIILLGSEIHARLGVRPEQKQLLASSSHHNGFAYLCSHVQQLLEVRPCQTDTRASPELHTSSVPSQDDAEGRLYSINFFSASLWNCAPCDWMFELPSIPTSDTPPYCGLVSRIRNLCVQLTRAHPAMRTYPADNFELIDDCHSFAALYSGPLASRVLQACWPRARVGKVPSAESKDLNFSVHTYDTADSCQITRCASRVRQEEAFEPPVEFTLFLPDASVVDPSARKAYLYVRIPHVFGDGFCAFPLARDIQLLLNRLSETKNPCKDIKDAPLPLRNSFEILSRRLTRSIQRERFASLYNFPDYLETRRRARPVFTRLLWLDETSTDLLASSAKRLQVSMESCVLCVLVVGLARALGWEWVPLNLMLALRDDPGATSCLGFFADYRWMGDAPCHAHASVQHVLVWLATGLKERRWEHDYSFAGSKRWDDDAHVPVCVNLLPGYNGANSADGQEGGEGVSIIPTNSRLWSNSCRSGRPIQVYVEEFVPSAHATLPDDFPRACAAATTGKHVIHKPMWVFRLRLDAQLFGPNVRFMVDFASHMKRTLRDIVHRPEAAVHWHDWDHWPQRYPHSQARSARGEVPPPLMSHCY